MGILDGTQLRLKQWVPLLKPGQRGVLIVPIAMHWFAMDGKNIHELAPDNIDKVLDEASDLFRHPYLTTVMVGRPLRIWTPPAFSSSNHDRSRPARGR